MTTRAAHAETLRRMALLFRAAHPLFPPINQSLCQLPDPIDIESALEAGADALLLLSDHPHEDGEDNGLCAPDNPSVISGPDQAAPTTETYREEIPIGPASGYDDPPEDTEADRCEERYPYPGRRDEPFAVTYRCGRKKGHSGPHQIDDGDTLRKDTDGQLGTAIQHPQIAPPEDEQIDQARSGETP